MRRAQNLYAYHIFGADFEALPEVQIELMIAHLKALSVYYPTQVEFLYLDVIFPSKNCILPRLLPVGAKGGRKVIFGMFLTLRQPRT